MKYLFSLIIISVVGCAGWEKPTAQEAAKLSKALADKSALETCWFWINYNIKFGRNETTFHIYTTELPVYEKASAEILAKGYTFEHKVDGKYAEILIKW